jgi:hypothetical protein
MRDFRAEELKLAEENERRDPHTFEHKCRAAARYLERDEAEWEELAGLVIAIEQGRLEAIRTYVMSPEELASWHDYMMSR